MHEFYLVSPLNLEAAIKAATEGDVQSAQLSLLALGNMLRDIDRRARSDKPLKCLCLDCDFVFSNQRKPMAFGVILPMFPKPGQNIMAHGICMNCFLRDDLEDAIEHALHVLFPHGNVAKGNERLQ
jgi:hypothetical protein